MQQVQNTTAAFVLSKYTEIEDDLGGKKQVGFHIENFT